jgi:hypothetical protein
VWWISDVHTDFRALGLCLALFLLLLLGGLDAIAMFDVIRSCTLLALDM